MTTPRTVTFWAVLLTGISSCTGDPNRLYLSAEDSLRIVNENIEHRVTTEKFLREDANSPFNQDTTIRFHGLKWFPINPYYSGRSILHRYANPETVIVMGTGGERRKQLRYGYFKFGVPTEKGNVFALKINVYKFTPSDARRYSLYRDHLSVWFTDKTTGIETYGVGRYVDVGNEHPDPQHIYTIDLNKAYNPYCAYSTSYSCAIPREEDYLDVALRVGEMNYDE